MGKLCYMPLHHPFFNFQENQEVELKFTEIIPFYKFCLFKLTPTVTNKFTVSAANEK